MNRNGLKVAVLAAALALSAGCGKKAPKELPPPPLGADGAGTGTDGAGGFGANGSGVGQAGLPGSRADFLQNVSSERVLFDTDSYSLDAEDRAILDSQAAYLQRNAGVRVTIEGHADERGTREYNIALGQRRANAARDVLVASGTAGARISTISYGKDRPAALGSTEDAWAQNRRAVTVVR